MKARLPLLFALVATSHAASAAIAVVNIDFYQAPDATSDHHSGTMPHIADSGTIWNHVTQTGPGVAASGPLQTSAGTASAITISISGISGTRKVASEQEIGGGFSNLMKDCLMIDADPSGTLPAATANTTIVTANGTFAGLTTGATYEIYFYGQGADMTGTAAGNAGENSLFTIGSDSKQTGWDGISGGNGLLAEGVEYVKFTVTATSTTLNFTWSNVVPNDTTLGIVGNVATDLAPNNSANVPKGSKSAGLNGIQIVQTTVPEPSAALVGGLGLLGLLIRRRR